MDFSFTDRDVGWCCAQWKIAFNLNCEFRNVISSNYQRNGHMDQMKIWRIVISAGTTFVIIGGGAMGVALISAEGRPISKTAITAALLTGLIASAKELRSMMALPPLTNGSSDSLNRLLSNPPLVQGPEKVHDENEKHE